MFHDDSYLTFTELHPSISLTNAAVYNPQNCRLREQNPRRADTVYSWAGYAT